MAQQKKRPILTSPRGRFSYPKLTEPDTKFKDEGEYSVKLIVPADAPGVQALIAQIDREGEEALEEAKANAKTAKEKKEWAINNTPYEVLEDDDGNPTGEVSFKFSMKASGVSKKTGKPWTRKPALFDAKGRPIKTAISVGGGTIGKVSFQVVPYTPNAKIGAGIKLALEAAQIIDLKSFGERSAAEMGFGAEEDGYDHEAESQGAADESSAADEGADAGDEGDF